MDFSQVVSTTIYLDNIADAQTYNEVYGQYLGPILPASTTVQQIAPASERKADQNDHFTELEQISLIAVRKKTP
jgi:enamine deaminase RidA (YjgF/YER057c/UK114 family)